MAGVFDRPEMAGAFLEELDEQLALLEQCILELEREGESPENIQKIFRVAHTLKGSSSSMGFEKMKLLTHEMENMLDKIRSRRLKATRDVINALFRCLDRLRALKEEFKSGEMSGGADIAGALEELRGISPDERSQSAGADAGKTAEGVRFSLDLEAQAQLEQAAASGMNVFDCEVRLSPGSPMKAARAYLVFNYLSQLGTVLKSEPNVLEDLDDSDAGRVHYLLVTHLDAQTVETRAGGELMDVERVKVCPCRAEAGEAQRERAGKKPAEGAEAKAGDAGKKASQTVRVDVERLEKMMDLVGELVIERTRIAQVAGALRDAYKSDGMIEELLVISNQVSRVTGELQEIVLKTRMLPVRQLFSRFPKLVRDLAEALGKEVELVMDGEETELDKTIIEELADPMIHLIRNAVDHGIEAPEERRAAGKPQSGVLRISAFHQENHVILEVQDDGRGIDPDKIREAAVSRQIVTAQEAASMSDREAVEMIFRAGFSTSQSVSEVSGRGVGMDIVRSHIDKLSGIIEVDTRKGEGTKFTVKLPLTLTILTGLLVKLGDETYALPLGNVVEIVRMPESEISQVKGQEIAVVRGRVLPLVWLHDYFNMPRKKAGKNIFVVVLGVAEKRLGLVVDELVGNQEIVVKPLGSYIGKAEAFSGATILGDGSVSCILDVAGVAKMVGGRKAARQIDGASGANQ